MSTQDPLRSDELTPIVPMLIARSARQTSMMKTHLKWGLVLANRPPASDAYDLAEKDSLEMIGTRREDLGGGRTEVGETVDSVREGPARGRAHAVGGGCEY
jgi:hypothetical protein